MDDATMYRWATKGVLGFIVGMFLAGNLVFYVWETPTDQIFPVYSWSLFRRVPAHDFSSVDIRLVAIDGQKLPAPRSVRDAPEYVASVPFGDNGSVVLKFRLGFRDDNEALIAEARSELERRFLVENVTYEVVEFEYDTIDYWRSGAYSHERSLAIFESGVPDGQ